jgi:poly(hydroxyalkanoate) granule-associated protein
MTNIEKVNHTIETAEEIARKIWLAGLGAYGKSFEEIQSQYEKLNSETTRLFEELVSKGQKLEAQTKEMLTVNKSIDEGVENLRNKLGLDSSEADTKIDDLSQKVDALTKAVNKLS